MSKKLLSAILGLIITSSAYATTNGYVGVSYVGAEYSEDDVDDVDLEGCRGHFQISRVRHYQVVCTGIHQSFIQAER
jgi:hypothetical protein